MGRCLRNLVALSFFLCGGACGYHFSGDGTQLDPRLQTVAVPVFENLTAEPGIEAVFTGALRQEFLTKSRLRVVPESEADAVFIGQIRRLSTIAVAHREAQDTVLTRLTVTLDVRCVDRETGKILWQDRALTYFEDYVQNPQAIVSFQNRQGALQRAAKETAARIFDRFMSQF
ncbi:LPS assembly lipoprotein LptE [Desulfosoma caldarium]|uniref:Lipopolysaccharide assembly protein n=1 Tax=Desulfosoma caldarium TaxID=610254 RepID=A0A3N1UNW2_9BACT|nr:LptE family protein [Desulfosoma caldarium]ROQ91089.1 lipopolysaccharide assembly protein [Desulfosoma caldarium]